MIYKNFDFYSCLGLIDFDEFVEMMRRAISEYNFEMTIRHAFGVFDLDQDGFISADELRVAYERLTGEEVTPEEALEMVAEADTDGDQMIGYEEFRAFVRSIRDEQ